MEVLNPMLQNLPSSQQLTTQIQNEPQNNLQRVVNMAKQLRAAKNPEATFNMLASQNPDLQNAVNLVRQSGGNPMQFCMNLALSKNQNLQEVLNALTR